MLDVYQVSEYDFGFQMTRKLFDIVSANVTGKNAFLKLADFFCCGEVLIIAQHD